MTDTARQGGPDKTASGSRDPVPDALDELRTLLLAPEQVQIGKLQERLDNPRIHAQDVGRVLPDAVSLRAARDNKLTRALTPTVEEVIRESVRKKPQTLVDAIFPVMGPAIRKAISHAFSEMVQSLNQALEYSLTLKGLKWRLEALRTGKSFAEVVLSHTLLYRVEQVFLIHKETGLLLDHVTADAVEAEDADLVSSMLTAIQDFVHDSFKTKKTGSLEAMQVGELTVWTERGPAAVLAAVIRGNAPVELRRVLQDTLEIIHIEQTDAFESFEGDASPFQSSRPSLEDCLRMQAEEKKKKSARLLWAVASLVILGLGVWLFFAIRDSSRWSDYVERLKAEPGIVVVSEEKSGGKYIISGLRDPMARDPEAILKTTEIAPERVVGRWEPYQSSHPEFVLARAKSLLQPPGTVTLQVEGSTLRAEGSASDDWIVEARRLAQALPAITRFEEENLVDAERGIERMKQKIESLEIRFEVGSAEITPDQTGKLDELIAEVRRLEVFLKSIGRRARIEILGYTDRTGSETLNRGLSRERAASVIAFVSSKGLEMGGSVSMAAADSETAGRERLYDRKTTFRVVLEK
ncbi:MAG: OmpA family protein [Blastocatellia bacterium]|nr:OmpA family protein [Blastocatellia bacterium]